MSFKYKHREKLVSGFVLIAIGLFIMFLTLVMINNKTFHKKIHFHTIISNANGLQKHPPVIFKGLEIGRVTCFSLDKENKIKVDFFIYNDFRKKAVTYSVISLISGTLSGDITHLELIVPDNKQQNLKTLKTDSFIAYIKSPQGIENISNGNIIAPDEGFGGVATKLNKVLEDLTNQKTVIKIDETIETLNLVLMRVEELLEAQHEKQGIVGRAGGESVNKILQSIERSMIYVEDTMKTLHENKKNISPIIINANKAIKNLNDTLKGVNNNPLIKGGIVKDKKYLGVELND